VRTAHQPEYIETKKERVERTPRLIDDAIIATKEEKNNAATCYGQNRDGELYQYRPDL